MYKIIGADQKEYGPISTDQIRQWITEGRINANSLIQLDGGSWKKAIEFPEFAMQLAATAPPPLPSHSAPIYMAPAGGQTNQMAVWAMVTGILSLICCQILGPLPIILGAVALSQIKKNPQDTGHGFAIAGIVLGILAVLMIIAGIVLAITMPGFMMNVQNQLQHYQP